MEQQHLIAPMSDEEAALIMNEHHDDFISLLKGKIIPEATNLVKKLFEQRPSRELQLIGMDLESIATHLVDLTEEGATEPFKDIPLEASEIHEVSPVEFEE